MVAFLSRTANSDFVEKRYSKTTGMENEKREIITELYRDVFSAHPWKYKPEALDTKDIRGELDFILRLRSGAVLTVEGEGDAVLGVRMVSDMRDVIEHSKPELIPLFVALSQRLDAKPHDVSYTHILGVREDHRNNGVGSTLIDKHIEHARDIGARYVLGWTVPKNESMIKLYKKHGYIQLENLEYDGKPIDYGIEFSNDGKQVFGKDTHIDGKVIYFVKDLQAEHNMPIKSALR